MADRSGIEWTDATWNPLGAFDRETGKRGWFCTHVSEGCRNCYAETMNLRLGTGHEYVVTNLKNVEFRLINLDQPMRWHRPRKIFVNSMTDLFHEAVPDDDILRIFKAMVRADHHVYQVLTKRSDRMNELLRKWTKAPNLIGILPDIVAGYIWMGVSVEDQASANERITDLLESPAAVRFVSAEPLLGPIDLTRIDASAWETTTILDCLQGLVVYSELGEGLDAGVKLDWVIVGGESGPGARLMNPAWVRWLRDQCVAARVPFFFKQWGEWGPVSPAWKMGRVGKKRAGRLLDGREWNEFPT